MVFGKLWILRGFNMDIDRINSELTKRFKALFTAGLKGNQTTIKGRRGPRLRGEEDHD